jgi:hypothetical protein
MRSLEPQEAAARDIGDALNHAGAGPIDQQHLAHQAGRNPRHQRRQSSDGGLFDAFGGDDDAQHWRLFDASGEENAALLSPCRIRSAAFCGDPEPLDQLTRYPLSGDICFLVLDLFSQGAMFAP